MRFHTEPGMEWKSIFQIWRENSEALPFKVARSTWSGEAGHYLIVERIEMKNWPYGAAWGALPLERCSCTAEKDQGSGTYNWKLLHD